MEEPHCSKCRYYHITWEKTRPRGCQAYGFATPRLPSQVVQETTGKKCLAFSPKKSLKNKGYE